MEAGPNARGDRFVGEDRAERQAGSEGLGDEDDVRLGGKLLVSEVASSTAQDTLNLVSDEEGTVLRGEGAGSIPKGLAHGMYAAFALNGFEDDGANGVVELGFEIGDVAKADKFDAGQEGRERQPIFYRKSDADPAEGAAMKGVLHGQDAVLGCGLVRRVGGAAGAEASEF